MAKVIVARDADCPWEEASPSWKARYNEGDRSLRFKRLLPSAAAMPNMQRTEYMPHHIEPLHRHPEDEVLFVLSGALIYEQDTFGFGDVIYVARDTAYSLRAGGEGASFVRVGLGDLSAPAEER